MKTRKHYKKKKHSTYRKKRLRLKIKNLKPKAKPKTKRKANTLKKRKTKVLPKKYKPKTNRRFRKTRKKKGGVLSGLATTGIALGGLGAAVVVPALVRWGKKKYDNNKLANEKIEEQQAREEEEEDLQQDAIDKKHARVLAPLPQVQANQRAAATALEDEYAFRNVDLEKKLNLAHGQRSPHQTAQWRRHRERDEAAAAAHDPGPSAFGSPPNLVTDAMERRRRRRSVGF